MLPHGPVGEPQGGLDVVLLRAADRVDLLGQASRPPAQRVDEMTAFAGEPRPFEPPRWSTSCPASSGPGVDEVPGYRGYRRPRRTLPSSGRAAARIVG